MPIDLKKKKNTPSPFIGLFGLCIKIAHTKKKFLNITPPGGGFFLKIGIVYFSVNFRIQLVASWGKRDETLELQITSMYIIGHS